MKAFVVNAARVSAPASNAPDNTRGFGWLNLEQMLTPAPTGQQVYSDDVELAVATGEVRQFAVQVADPAVPLWVTLVWTDRPGNLGMGRVSARGQVGQTLHPAAPSLPRPTASLPASSGRTVRHASITAVTPDEPVLYLIALTEIYGDTEGRAYYERRRGAGSGGSMTLRISATFSSSDDRRRSLPDVNFRP